VPLRTRLARTVVATAIAVVALVSVGLTAPAESPFTIDIEPVFMRLDAASIAESQAHALAVTVNVKLGALHLHYEWSAIPLTPVTTKPGATLL
jgi:hypothetical protein